MGLRGPLALLYDEPAVAQPSLEPIPASKPYKNITINLPLDLLEELTNFAFRQRKKKNAVIREALEAHMKAQG